MQRCCARRTVHNAKVTTLQSGTPEAEAFAVGGERIVAAGGEADIMGLRLRLSRAARKEPATLPGAGSCASMATTIRGPDAKRPDLHQPCR